MRSEAEVRRRLQEVLVLGAGPSSSPRARFRPPPEARRAAASRMDAWRDALRWVLGEDGNARRDR